MPLWFSYGTLRDPAVQRANSGRELAGREDRLPGCAERLVEIADPEVVRVSGQSHHPVVVVTVGRLRDDLASGPWDERFGHLRAQPEFLGSLRLLVGMP